MADQNTELQKLKKELEALKTENVQFREENAQFREALDSKDTPTVIKGTVTVEVEDILTKKKVKKKFQFKAGNILLFVDRNWVTPPLPNSVKVSTQDLVRLSNGERLEEERYSDRTKSNTYLFVNLDGKDKGKANERVGQALTALVKGTSTRSSIIKYV